MVHGRQQAESAEVEDGGWPSPNDPGCSDEGRANHTALATSNSCGTIATSSVGNAAPDRDAEPSLTIPCDRRRLRRTPSNPSPPSRQHRRSPTKFGEAHPARDAALFAAFVGVLLLVGSADFGYGGRRPQPPGGDNDREEAVRPATPNTAANAVVRLVDSVNDLQSKVSALLAEAGQFRVGGREEDCSVYWGPSTVPGAGWGLFAGRDIQEGDVAVPAPPHPGALLLLPRPAEGGGRTSWLASPYALLLKHHPVLPNVRGRLLWAGSDPTAALFNAFQLRAMRNISAGSELFAEFDAHPHSAVFLSQRVVDYVNPAVCLTTVTSPSAANGDVLPQSYLSLFRRIPTPSDYDVADLIWDDADSAVRWLQNSDSRQPTGRSQRGPQASAVVQSAVQRAVGRTNPALAQLLPSHGTPRRGRTTALESLLNRTVKQLRIEATCLLDDVRYSFENEDKQEKEECRSRPAVTAVAGRTVAAGATLTHIPWLVLPQLPSGGAGVKSPLPPPREYQAPTEEADDACLTQPSWHVRLCPLAQGLLFRSAALDGGEAAESALLPNIRFQWAHNKVAGLSLRELWELGPTAEELVWEVRATRLVSKGDVVYYDPKSMEALVSDAWKAPSPQL